MQNQQLIPVEPQQRYVYPNKGDEVVIEIKGLLNGKVIYQELYPNEAKRPEELPTDMFNQFIRNGYFRLVYPVDQFVRMNEIAKRGEDNHEGD